MGLADEVLTGNRRALARLATHIENDDEIGRAGLTLIYPRTGNAHIIGVTGPPGAGKSTLINALIGEFRARGRSVAVVAIDPTSPLSGGATLGDRIRMLERQSDPAVFIRSMASRGCSGGLAPAAAAMIHLFSAAGFDLVLVETVGVGQEEVDIARLVESVVLVQVPGSGDEVQLLKAGLLEVADIYVVNKADHSGAEETLRGLRAMVGHSHHDSDTWKPPVLRSAATDGEGTAKIADALENHRSFLMQSGRLEERRRAIARTEITNHVNTAVLRRLSAGARYSTDAELIDDVAMRRLTSFAAASRLLDHWDEAKLVDRQPD